MVPSHVGNPAWIRKIQLDHVDADLSFLHGEPPFRETDISLQAVPISVW